MLNLSTLKPKIKKPSQVRRGRGLGSGRGAYSGRGIKGQKARTGGNIKPGFEGGRQPLIRQMPKIKGFRSFHPKAQTVDLSVIAKAFADGAQISPKELEKKRMIRSTQIPVKILGNAGLSRKYQFTGIKFSEAAKAAVTKAGGIIKE